MTAPLISLALVASMFAATYTFSDTTTYYDNSSSYSSPSPAPSASSSELLSGELRKICECESGLRQFDESGNVLRGRINPQDVGICQINLTYHEAAADQLGFDLLTEAGNIR
jgi:hypothetical protein